jgi:tetratricopeptide (TPR) repeat protein
MRSLFAALILSVGVLLGAMSDRVIAAGGESAADPLNDPAPCLGAAAIDDDDKIIAACGVLVDHQKTAKPDLIKALLARAGALARNEQIDRAIADYDAALLLDPTLANGFNARGELWHKKGDHRRALNDFGAAIRLNPQHDVARVNHKALAQELEKLGAQIAVNGKPSFNCAKARRAVERAICGDPELANLDREINALALRVVREVGGGAVPAGRTLQRAQDAFLAARDAGFGRPGYDLRAAMKARRQQLSGADGF